MTLLTYRFYPKIPLTNVWILLFTKTLCNFNSGLFTTIFLPFPVSNKSGNETKAESLKVLDGRKQRQKVRVNLPNLVIRTSFVIRLQDKVLHLFVFLNSFILYLLMMYQLFTLGSSL